MALTLAAVAIDFARVWVGVHYPGDILAAVVIAALAVLVVAGWSRSPATRRGRAG